MQTILAGTVLDLDTAGAAFRSGYGSRTFTYGIKEGGAHLHADGILFLFETIAARDPAASGIGIACIVARHFDVPVIFAKKSKSINIEGDVYVAEVESFTHKCKNQVIVSKKFLNPEDKVLIIDDFLANGCALQGLISIVKSAGAEVSGIGIAIEKGFQPGGQVIRNLGFHLESLAIVDSMDYTTGEIKFRENA